MLLRQWLQQAETALQALAQQDPHATDLAFEASRLWADVLDKNPASQRLYLDQPLSETELDRLNTALQRRAAGEPLAYITGRWWFWDLELLKGSDSYLKEYNRSALALVYIHEGVPGHFVQLESRRDAGFWWSSN